MLASKPDSARRVKTVRLSTVCREVERPSEEGNGRFRSLLHQIGSGSDRSPPCKMQGTVRCLPQYSFLS